MRPNCTMQSRDFPCLLQPVAVTIALSFCHCTCNCCKLRVGLYLSFWFTNLGVQRVASSHPFASSGFSRNSQLISNSNCLSGTLNLFRPHLPIALVCLVWLSIVRSVMALTAHSQPILVAVIRPSFILKDPVSMMSFFFYPG